jgi:nucleoside-triphosphatase THEP1
MAASNQSFPAPSLLIAITGAPGSGKTRLLAELAAWHGSTHQPCEGFLAVAGTRAQPDLGAAEYRLQLLATGEELPWLVRDETHNPPYRFDSATHARLEHWAHALPLTCPLVVLDEFGKFEARGEGLLPLWPALRAARPLIMVLAVRAGFEEAIEEKIGQRFDLRIPADAPDALIRLQRACADLGEWTRIGLFGGAAGGIELSAGTALHLAKVPLRGLALSSLQGAMMTFTGFGLAQPGRVIWVPFISAGLKALSPGGSRLRPMVAIAAQGLLYGTAVQAIGWNIFGVTLGGALIGAWAATQGFLLQYLLLGDEMIKAYDTAVLWLAQHWHITAPGLPWLVGAWALLHALVAGGVSLAAWRFRAPPKKLRELIERETGPAAPRAVAASPGVSPPSPKWWQPLRELARWQFWLPLLVVSAILLSAGRSWETVAWLTLRVVAVGMVLLTLVSLLRPARWADRLRRHGWWGPALAFSSALRRTGRH